jgi:alpha-N-arabinofuranosidase
MIRTILTAALILVGAVSAHAAVDVQGTVQADKPGATMSRYIFGQFAEHLGFGI